MYCQTRPVVPDKRPIMEAVQLEQRARKRSLDVPCGLRRALSLGRCGIPGDERTALAAGSPGRGGGARAVRRCGWRRAPERAWPSEAAMRRGPIPG